MSQIHGFNGLIFSLLLCGLLMIPSALALSYDDMARYPDQNIGTLVTITGEVSQVEYSTDNWYLRLMTKKTSYGYSGDDIFVYFKGSPDNGRILEDDIVQVTGVFAGPFKYETIFGAVREVPLLSGTSYVVNPLYARY